MPRSSLFIACEKVITAAEDTSLSIISIIDRIEITVPANVHLDTPASIPKSWTTLCILLPSESDLGKEFEQHMTITSSKNGEVLMETAPSNVAFLRLGYSQRVITSMAVLPISAGDLVLRMLVRERGAEAWDEIAQYVVGVGLNRT